MQNLKKNISDALLKALNESFSAEGLPTASEIEKLLEYPPENMGDLAFPCFRFSKLLRKSPVMIAEALKGADGVTVVSWGSKKK